MRKLLAGLNTPISFPTKTITIRFTFIHTVLEVLEENFVWLYTFFLKYTELWIGVIGFVMSGVVTWHIVRIGMVKALVDQNSHLNLARQVFDSFTPGFSQIGYWPPLLHVLMAPAARVDALYHSGLAGYVVLAPALILGAICLYRIGLILTRSKEISLWGALLYIVNPFMLYYTTTAMMEVLYMAFLLATVYYLLRWLEKSSLIDLIITGVFLSLTTLSRFEGFFAIPVCLAVVIIALLLKRKSYHEIEAATIIIAVVGIAGAVSIFAYGYIYGGDPLAFARSRWSAYNQQRDYLLPTEHSIYYSFLYELHASYHVLGEPVVIFGLLCGLLTLGIIGYFAWKRMYTQDILAVFSALALTFSPFLFDMVALFRGNAIIYIPELPPYGVYFNERYGLYWFGFIIVALVFLMGYLHHTSASNRFGHRVNNFLIIGIMSGILIWSMAWSYQIIFAENVQLVKDSAQGYPSEDQAQVANFLKQNYKGGHIFMTRALHDFIAVEAHVPLSEYIHESNYKYFDQVLERPWLFTKWVVMYNPASETNGNWAQLNEKISLRYAFSDEFHKYYEKVVENGRERLYRLKPEAVVEYAAAHDYDVSKIPSLNSDIKSWDPDTIYATLDASHFSITNVSEDLRTPQAIVQEGWMPFYTHTIAPAYENGYHLEKDRVGNTSDQALALNAAVLAHDRKTFDAIWEFTKEHLRHTDDALFASTFSKASDSAKIQIIHNEPASVANTDIAYALYRAGKEWNNPAYIGHADSIAKDIWNYEVTSVEGHLIVAESTVQESDKTVKVSIAALAPYAYREFALHDSRHNWNKLAEDSVVFLHRVSRQEVRKSANIFIPPEKIELSKKDNKFILYEDTYYSAHFTSQTASVMWRLARDTQTANNETSKKYLYVVNVFDEALKQGSICAEIIVTADTYSCSEASSTYIAPLSVWMIKDRAKADMLVKNTLVEKTTLKDLSAAPMRDKIWYWLELGMWIGKL